MYYSDKQIKEAIDQLQESEVTDIIERLVQNDIDFTSRLIGPKGDPDKTNQFFIPGPLGRALLRNGGKATSHGQSYEESKQLLYEYMVYLRKLMEVSDGKHMQSKDVEKNSTKFVELHKDIIDTINNRMD